MRLASEDALATVAVRFPELPPRFREYRSDMLDHPVAGQCLRYYVILTECPELLRPEGLSEAELHWSRYYWLVRFARLWTAFNGPDVGLEQQVFQLLEYAPSGWDALPEVEAAAERAAAEQLRAAETS